MVRLDRLLDLLDAARFGQDEDARETLWEALGGHPTGVGEGATRDATARILQDALALGDAAERAAAPDVGAYTADIITLLTTDLQRPGSAEDLSIQTLVYRSLAEGGHPRVADNARWRLYDHVRGTLAGAVQMPPAQRMEVAVQALYVERDSLEDLLADTAPHVRPPWPEAKALWELLSAQTEALSQHPRWAPVVERRMGDDEVLFDTMRTVLPAARRPDWPLAEVAAGTGRAEDLAPVLHLRGGQLIADAGRSHARTLPLDDDDMVELSRAVGTATASDGRGAVLLVADPMLPAPQLRTGLRAIFRAQTERIDIAIAEPRLAPAEGMVVTALPLYVTHAAGQKSGDRAFASARVHVHLDGRGPQIAIDGHWFASRPENPRALRALAQDIARAYPAERGARISLGPDVQLRQLLDLLIALAGGPERPFAAVGWFADGAMPDTGKSDGDTLLSRRLALAWPGVSAELQQSYPLKDQDQARLEGFAEELAVCLPELSVAKPPEAVAFVLRFEEGRLRSAKLEAGRRRFAKDRVAAVLDCVEEEGYALRLRSHREAMTITATLSKADTRALVAP